MLGVACVPDGPAPASGPAPRAFHQSPPVPAAPARGPGTPAIAVRATALPAPPTPLPVLTEVYQDDFSRAELGPDWYATSPAWRISEGRLCVADARNHPVWLSRRLPVNARIEFEATSTSPEGDLKAEYWGDGRSAAASVSYTAATSYLTIFGGWKNQFHVLARIDEHAPDRLEVQVNPDGDDLRARPVEPNRTYHFKVERSDGRTVRWFVDDLLMHELVDPAPLAGVGHQHFGFNEWMVRVCFDALRITPLG